MTELSFRTVPGPGFVAGCTVTTWVEVSAQVGRIAYLLIGHAPPRRPGETASSVEDGLLGMIGAMRLRPAADRVPDVGARLLLRGAYVALDYGHPQFHMRIPAPGGEWLSYLTRGGQVCVTIGLDPIPPGAGPDAVGAYLDRIAATGRAYMGATTLRGR
ncbi:hypothetical protein [Streptomyces similanensis]|uniref:Uncharacterized protein n=1 Tax=Streptomyces similanensis TaxID=1274988 RepID=A0ABP9KHM9_9ACTN